MTRARSGFLVAGAALLLVATACAPPVGPPGPTPTPTGQVASANQRSCAVAPDGQLDCWGTGPLGVAGAAGSAQRLEATAVEGLADVTEVAAGLDFTCALEASGVVSCWGRNSVGQLGDGTTTDHALPSPVAGVADAVDLSVSSTPGGHACAVLADGHVRCWGGNGNGQLGDGSTTDRATPVQVGGIGTATQVATGPGHTCALLADATVHCWGSGRALELGNALPIDQPYPVQVLGLPAASAITAGGELDHMGFPRGFTCALATDGTEWCWGRGGPPTANPGTPTATGIGNLAEISGMCAITGDRDAHCVEFGVWTALDTSFPVADVSPDGACVQADSGAVECRGPNDGGRLGNGFGSYVVTPRPPVTGLTGAVELASGDFHSCARLDTGEVSCWGNGVLGQRGDGTTTFQPTPTTVTGIDDAIAVGAGEFTSCAVRSDGSVWCWGSTDDGATIDSTPVQIAGIDDAVDVDGGRGSGCAIRSTSEVACWGDFAGPVAAVDDVTTGVQLAVGAGHGCALLADGTVRCFPPTGGPSEPVAGLDEVVSLSAGTNATCAVRSDGSLWCWGDGVAGLAPGWTPDPAVPAPVPGLSGVVASAVENNRVCAVRSDGSVGCIGSQYLWGLLGDGSMTDSAVPVQPLGLGVTTAASAAPQFGCALQADGTVRCWGYNRDNQLGDGGPHDTTEFGPVIGTP